MLKTTRQVSELLDMRRCIICRDLSFGLSFLTLDDYAITNQKYYRPLYNRQFYMLYEDFCLAASMNRSMNQRLILLVP